MLLLGARTKVSPPLARQIFFTPFSGNVVSGCGPGDLTCTIEVFFRPLSLVCLLMILMSVLP
jgi:hypothetical protein